MLIKTLLNHMETFKSFVFNKAWLEGTPKKKPWSWRFFPERTVDRNVQSVDGKERLMTPRKPGNSNTCHSGSTG
jgi:hypothetical protein